MIPMIFLIPCSQQTSIKRRNKPEQSDAHTKVLKQWGVLDQNELDLVGQQVVIDEGSNEENKEVIHNASDHFGDWLTILPKASSWAQHTFKKAGRQQLGKWSWGRQSNKVTESQREKGKMIGSEWGSGNTSSSLLSSVQ